MKSTKRIAVSALTRGYANIDGYSVLLERTKLVMDNVVAPSRYPWISIDIILFHEGNISDEQKAYIVHETACQDLKFIDVSADFERKLKGQSSTYCHPTDLSDQFSHGYKCMCAFWLDGFLKYTAD